MIEFLQEAALPKLSQTSIYARFNADSNITKIAIYEINKAKDNRETPEDIEEIQA